MTDMLDAKSDIGNIFDILNQYSESNTQRYSYLDGKWADFEQWRSIAKAKVFELLNYFPEEAQLEAVVLSIIDKGEYRQEEVEFNTAKNVRVRGSLLIPNTGEESYPAIIAIHDHGGFYYYGREKIMEQENEAEELTKFKKSAYGGRSYANELVKRGYIVLCIDGFYFGSRKLDVESVSDERFGEISSMSLKGIIPGTSEYIRTYNRICGQFESLVVKHILTSGTTWPGMLFHDDRKCIDYLYSRKEVDKNRIGCCGLSIGGFRAAHLAALDGRIKAAVVAGWMPTYKSLLFNRLRHHTYMIYIPNLQSFMELPDVMSLAAPNSLFVQQCAKDFLYNLEGMQESCATIEADAFEWFDKCFKQANLRE